MAQDQSSIPLSSPRFSLLYLERGKATNDSKRFRRRLATKFEKLCGDLARMHVFGELAVAEFGADVPRLGTYYRPVDMFLGGELRDVLDSITLFFSHLRVKREAEDEARNFLGQNRWTPFNSIDPVEWRDFVARAMREENVSYSVDSDCVVHYYVDEEFERNRVAALALLSNPLLANARSSYEDAFRHLDGQSPDTKAAVRSLFEAAEVLTKQICPDAQQLNKKLVETVLKERYLSSVQVDATEKKVLEGLFDSFAVWVNAMHNYRHGQSADEPVAPGEETTVFVLSTGSAFVRLLASCFLRLQT